MTLRYGFAPAARGLVRNGDSPLWRFPDDYLTRFDNVLLQVTTAQRTSGGQDPQQTASLAE
jgi:hypothetical protein